MVEVGLFDSLRRRTRAGQKPGTLRKANAEDTRHLDEWAASRRGVEAYVEPRTTVTETTVVLIAHDGEWTRRRIPDPRAGHEFGRRLSIPVYNVQLTGYPQRMREYLRRQKRSDA